MGKYVVEEEKPREPISDDAIFPAKILKVEEIEKTFDGKKKKRINFTFRLEADGLPWDGWELEGDVPAFLNAAPENRFRQWVEAVLGNEVPVGFQVDTDALVGQMVRVVVGARPYTDKYNNDKIWNWVKDLLPPGGLRYDKPNGF